MEAKDGQNNTRTNTYAVTTTGEAKTFEYDGNGNLRYEKQPNGSVIREYRWDQQNRLVRYLQGTHESVYEYDGESHRVRIKELTSSVETKNETFVWCGRQPCQKRASNGSTVLRSYLSEGFEEGSSDYFYARDHLGSVREVVASNGTTIASRLSYDPWGKLTESGSGALSDFTYTGHHFDRPTSLSLAPARGYDASLGRWLSMDPIGLAGGLNLYGYVDQQPVNAIDPTGNRTECMAGDDCGAGPYPGPPAPVIPPPPLPPAPPMPGPTPPKPPGECKPLSKEECKEILDEANHDCWQEILLTPKRPGTRIDRLQRCVREVMDHFGCPW